MTTQTTEIPVTPHERGPGRSQPSVRRRSTVGLLLVAVAVLLLAGCAPEANPQAGVPAPDGELAGFWLGLWQGVIAPVTFVISLFSDGVGIYEVHNNGGWYDFGYVLGLGMIVGGGSAASSR